MGKRIGRELLPHNEVLELGHDPLAVIDRQTDLTGRKPLKSFLNLQLRSLDFAKFIAPFDRHRPFHRRLQKFGDFHAPVIPKAGCF